MKNQCHPIYNEMITRNRTYLKNNSFSYDSLILDGVNDKRRCLAIIAEGEWTFSPRYREIVKDIVNICGNGDFCNSKIAIEPRTHHTFLTLKPFAIGGNFLIDKTYLKKVVKALKDMSIKPYEVCFDKIVPVSTGITVVGGDSILDWMNERREELRKLELVTEDRYKMDILHFTSLRWGGFISDVKKKQVLDYIDSIIPQPLAKVRVSRLNIVEASWLCRPEECKVLTIIDLYENNK